MSTNTLKQSAWLIITLGIIDTLFLIYAVIEKVSYSGGSIIYIFLGIFLLQKSTSAYKFSQFIFTTLFSLIPAGIVITLLLLYQIYTATDTPLKWDVFGWQYIILIIYMSIIVYLTYLLHHPNTRKELSLSVYDSNIHTLYIPPKRLVIFPLLIFAFFAALSWPFVLSNPYKIVTAGLSKDKNVQAEVGDIKQFDLLSTSTQNWHSITLWRVHGDCAVELYKANLDPNFNLDIAKYRKITGSAECAHK